MRNRIKTHRIVKDHNSGSYLIAGKGHSYGSFKSWGEANTFIKEIAAEDEAHKARMAAAAIRIRKNIEEQDADFLARKRARLEADRLLYEGRAS